MWRALAFHPPCSVITYSAVLILVFFVWHFISDGDFSFLMTLGSLLTLVSLGLLVVKFRLSTEGASLKTLQAYALVYAARLCSIMVHSCAEAAEEEKAVPPCRSRLAERLCRAVSREPLTS